jgi:aconitate hydratase
MLLGVKGVIAESFERIHRSNLLGMGVLPMTFEDGQNPKSLGLDGSETFDIDIPADLKPKQKLKVKALRKDGKAVEFTVTCRAHSPGEVDYFRHGGILQFVLRQMAR